MRVMKALRKFWKFVWEDNSLLSWITAFALVFVFIFVIFFPAMRLIFSTALPMVVIESGSMHHQYSFDQWYDQLQWSSDVSSDKYVIYAYEGWMGKKNIQVFAADGKLVLEDVWEDQLSYLLDLNGVSSGVYFVRISDDKKYKVRKIVVY